MADTARLTRHPRDETSALLNIGPAHAKTMGLFAPARWASDLKAYLVNDENVDSLIRFLALQGVHVTDDRSRGGGDALGPLPECANCGQPAKRDREPEHCPDCGKPWQSVVFTQTRGFDWRPDPRTCTVCLTEQRGTFRFCQQCGAVMPDPVHVVKPTPEREHLDDPQPIGEAVEEWVEQNHPSNG